MLHLDANQIQEFLKSEDPIEVQAARFAQDLTMLADEGYIEIRKDEDGTIRLYPVYGEL